MKYVGVFMKFIVGLGNPGPKYEQTRHNIGFMVIDELSSRWNIPVTQMKWKGYVGEGTYKGEKVVLLKPLTYMNLSGESVRAMLEWYKTGIEDVVIIYDDIDLDLGKIRLREKGSAGGHNGVKSIIAHTGTDKIKRIKVGVTRPPIGYSVPDYVLSSFAKSENELLDRTITGAADACEHWIQSTFLLAMSRFNGTV